eukprot:scaffold441794_cov34-Prasinocladus_malaysianus.AAC.1
MVDDQAGTVGKANKTGSSGTEKVAIASVAAKGHKQGHTTQVSNNMLAQQLQYGLRTLQVA